MLGTPYSVAGANALQEDDAINPAAMMHGRMAPMGQGAMMGQVPTLNDPRLQAPMTRPPVQPMTAAPQMPTAAPQARTMPPAMPGGANDFSPMRPTAPAPTAAPQAGKSRAPSLTPPQEHDAMRNMLQSKYQEMGITIDDHRLEELTNFAVAKRQGRMAKQMGKQSKAALAKYFGALVQRDTAEQSFHEHSQRLQRSIAAAIADKDEEKYMQYRDQLAAAKIPMDGARQRASGYRKVIESRYKIDPKYLENPVSLFAFINDETDDDYNDVMGDNDPTP